ncbi:MAG: hypothetical protein IKN27_01775, partial [Selenomonadaceae bacterium]|nr:hypothetical protein [Selenomonadaceae bacterium]
DFTKDFSPEKIIDVIKGKSTFGEKFPALIKIFLPRTSRLDDWAKFIFAHNLPQEIILPRINELNHENKLVAVEKYFDTLTVEEIADFTKDFSPEEIIDAIKDKSTFGEKLPVIIENSSANKFFWACYLVDNVELFRQIKIGEDVLIFFMYESVNRWNGKLQDLNTLIKLLQEKIDDIEAAPRAKIVYCYICAAFAKHFAKRLEDRGETESRNEYLSTCDKFINDADDTFTEIFNLLVGKIKTIAENPDEATIEETFKDFFKSEAQLLPSCRKFHDDENCIFCEAVTWNKKVVGNDGKESFDLQSWCPRGRIAEFCSRLFPKIELPAKDWSVIELMAKLNLVPRENLPENHKYNLEFFTRLGGEFNRIKDLLERIKCRKCGKSMRAVKGLATWKEITNLRKTAYGDHFAIFAATTFSCQNKNCSEKDELVYLSYCWHCGEIIDSRDNHVRIKGFYLCNKCGAGYRDFVGTDHYTIFPGEICPSCTKCPKCGCQDFAIIGIDDGKGQLQCTKCKRVMNAPLKITSTSKDGIHVKGKCSCGHRLEWNTKHLWSNLTPIPW